MDGTGSTVVIYKTETGERLVLKDIPVPLAVAKSGRLHPTNPSPAQHGSAAAGRVMIIDEQPSVGASFGTVSNNTVDCNTSVTTTPAGAETTVNTWAKILLQPPVPGEGSSNDMVVPMQKSNVSSVGKSTATHNYHLRFQVKMPAPSSKPV
ncbi:uncharacterized protein LOC118503820 [Anopheles stephensi]|uniref:uncharacterized protein LOC118503820 n=1 Tax=Anopheles stephensi TaxID=30069 RepID=UPI0016588BE8|nr:uncharacterized protein LOC118503820 [Anopheles stephensi]